MDKETKERMDGLHSQDAERRFRDATAEMVHELKKEGFDEYEIHEFLQELTKDSFVKSFFK